MKAVLDHIGIAVPDLEAAMDDDVGDDLLRLMFTACHPVLATEGRLALTLRLVAGLTTDEIARAFLVPVPTMAQRITRAKRTLSDARVPFEVPRQAERAERLSSVLEVIYLVFNEGYAATAGQDLLQRTAEGKFLRLNVDGPQELAAGFPTSRAELFKYRAIVLGSVEASAFTQEQLRMLADFVSVRGGGILFLGGRSSFGEGGFSGTPLADVLPFYISGDAVPDSLAPFQELDVRVTPAG